MRLRHKITGAIITTSSPARGEMWVRLDDTPKEAPKAPKKKTTRKKVQKDVSDIHID